LCDPEKRSNYDKWRKSGIAISYKQWLGMKEHVHAVSILNLYMAMVYVMNNISGPDFPYEIHT
jgi:hypothetical protein